MGIEIQILDLLQNFRTPAGDAVIPLITKLGDKGIIWILLAAVLLLIPKTRRTGAILTAALCVDLVGCSVIIKNLFARVRPFDVNTSVQLLIPKPADFSFPSGHTAASFSSAAALFFAGEKKLWKPVLALAVIIAFTRLYLYVHYPTDILGGMAVGTAAGYLGFWIITKWENRNLQ